jgi:hypothetical protein
MMDYFDIFNSMASTHMTGKIFRQETDTPQVDEEVIESWKEYQDELAETPNDTLFENLITDTAEEWWDSVNMTMPTYQGVDEISSDEKKWWWGVKGQSSFDTRGKCATRLKSKAVITLKDPSDMKYIRRSFSAEGVPTLYVPIGTSISYLHEPQDTAGGFNTSFIESETVSNDRAGVDQVSWKFNDTGLDQAVTNVMKAERPDLFDEAMIENMTLDEYPIWWEDVSTTYQKTTARVLEGNYTTYFNQTGMIRQRGGNNSTTKTYDAIGKYRQDIIYGYDWEAEVESQKGSGELLEGESLLTHIGYRFVQMAYVVSVIATFFVGSAAWAKLGGKVAFWASNLGRKAFMLAVAGIELLAIDYMALELPYRVVQIDVTHNHNQCGFPPNGHYHSYWVNVYDPTLTDSYGVPHCPDGEHKPILVQEPLKYDKEIPCCPDGTNFDITQKACIGKDADGNDIVALTGGGIVNTEIIPKEEISGLQTGTFIALGIAGVVILSTLFGSKGDQ